MQVDEEKVYTVTDFTFLGSKITADHDYCHEIKRHLLLGKKAITNLNSVFKNERHHSANKSPSSQSYGFTSSHIWMWELNHKEDWTLKNWCFQIIVLRKTLESPLDSKEKKLVYFQRKSTLNIQSKEWCWSWSANTLATWCEELTHWKKPWC